MDSSQYPLSMHVAPVCEIINNQFITCIRSDSETTVLNKTIAASKGKLQGENIYLYLYNRGNLIIVAAPKEN